MKNPTYQAVGGGRGLRGGIAPRYLERPARQDLKSKMVFVGGPRQVGKTTFAFSLLKREVDFVVVQDRKPLFAVECKSGDKAVGPALVYFKERTAIPRFYQVHTGKGDYMAKNSGIRVLPFQVFCSELGLP